MCRGEHVLEHRGGLGEETLIHPERCRRLTSSRGVGASEEDDVPVVEPKFLVADVGQACRCVGRGIVRGGVWPERNRRKILEVRRLSERRWMSVGSVDVGVDSTEMLERRIPGDLTASIGLKYMDRCYRSTSRLSMTRVQL